MRESSRWISCCLLLVLAACQRGTEATSADSKLAKVLDGNELLPESAVIVISQSADYRIIDGILKRIYQHKPDVQIQAIDILSDKSIAVHDYCEKECFDKLVKIADSYDKNVRKHAVDGLNKLYGDESVKVFIHKFDDSDAAVRQAALDALVSVANNHTASSRIAEAYLRDKLDDENAEIVLSELDYFISHGIPGDESHLISILNKSNSLELAEKIINSDNLHLKNVGEHWAKSHNYGIFSIPGSSHVTWGSH